MMSHYTIERLLLRILTLDFPYMISVSFVFLRAAGLKTCQKERLAALAWGGSAPAGVFVPQCTNDGEYKLSQCVPSGDYCWCVDQNGKAIPRTLSTDKKGCADTGLSLLTFNKPYFS